jgi:hypothetical protein
VYRSSGSPLLDGAECFRNLLDNDPNPKKSVLELLVGIDTEGDSGLLPDLRQGAGASSSHWPCRSCSRFVAFSSMSAAFSLSSSAFASAAAASASSERFFRASI